MRSLTKSGIRELTAQYRSVLKKCAFLNVIVLLLGSTSAFSETTVTDWSSYRTAVNGNDSVIKVNADIIYGGSTNVISRDLSIVGTSGTGYLDGHHAYQGLSINGQYNTALEKFKLQNFKTQGNGGAISNTKSLLNITDSDFIGNSAQNGGAICNYRVDNKTGAINITAKDKDVIFDGNYVISSDGKGGAIFNDGEHSNIGLYAKAGRSITFKGGEEGSGKYDVDGIWNNGTLNIGNEGTVNLNTVKGEGDINIITNATVTSKDVIAQNKIKVFSGKLITRAGNLKITEGIDNDGTLELIGGTQSPEVLVSNISGEGTTKIKNGVVTITTDNLIDITQESIDIESDAQLTSTDYVDITTDDLTNNGTMNLLNNSSYIRTAGLTNNGEVNVSNTIELYNGYDTSLLTNWGTMNVGAIFEVANTTPGSFADLENYGNINAHIISATKLVNYQNASLTITDGMDIDNLYNLGIINLGKNIIASAATNLVDYFKFEGGLLNLKNDSINTFHIHTLNLAESGVTANLMIDADLSGIGKIDQLNIGEVDPSGTGTLHISDIRILSDGQPGPLLLFTGAIPTKVEGHLKGLPGPVFIYNADYANGQITFTQTGVHPYLYAPSTMAQATANITGQIAGLAMDKLDIAVADSEKGLAAGDMLKANNAWVKVMGFDDDVEFKGFNKSIDSKTYTLAGGFNTDKVKFDNFDAAFGIYGGYIGGRQKYTSNKIEQDGGYVGLSSELTTGNAFLLSTINAGFINNETENMYGTDKFDTRWFGIGLKGGYNYALTNSVVFQPNVYAGYTLVNTEDYTSKSGVRINNDNLNFFEIDPGFKLMTQIDKNWLGFIQGKYAIVMDNGGKTTVNEIVLPNISAKNYFEYGFGMNKSLTDAWSLNSEINRRDGGHTGWNGSVEFKYNF